MSHSVSNVLKRTFLSLDALESREVPAASTYLADAGHTLVISGTDKSDLVTVTQNDRAGTLTVASVGGATQTYSSARIGTVQVNLRGGEDRLEYATRGDVRNAIQLRVDTGSGDDTSIVRWADEGSTARAGLTVVVSGQAGNDAIGFRIGRLDKGVSVNLRADGGDGNDAIGIESLAPGSGATLDTAFRGGAGNDSLGIYSTGDMPTSGRAAFDLSGGSGDDSISVNAAGRLAGRFEVRGEGGAGNDQLAIVSVDVTGPSKVRASFIGGSGDDQFVTLAKAKTLDATVDGGSGGDSGAIINEAKIRGVEQYRVPTDYELRPGPLPLFNPVLPTSVLSRAGRTVEYYSAGSSKPGEPVVVLLTGFGGTIDYWQTVPASIARNSMVIAVNRPGYGKTSITSGDYAIEAIEDIRAVVKSVAGNRPVMLVGHSLGGLYANLFARLHPDETAGVVFVDATAAEAIVRIDDVGIPYGGLGDPNDAGTRLQPPGVRQEIIGAVSLARSVMAADAFPNVPVVSLRAGPADLLAEDPEGDAWYQSLGELGSPGETRRVPDSGHNIQYDRPDAVVKAVADVLKLAAQSADSKFISRVLSEVATQYGIPGMSAAVVVGNTVTTGAAGVRQVGGTDPVRTGDRFANGSTTKAMTATLAGVLVEKGLIRWNSTIVQVFPELKGKIRLELENATLESFLKHRSGLIGGSSEDASAALQEKAATLLDLPADLARREILATLLNDPLAVKPGEFYYSNAGYAVVAAMLERVTGKAYESLMQQYLFGPLGMASATFDATGDIGARTPVGTDPVTREPVTFDSEQYLESDPSILYPAGTGLRMNVTDWSKLVRIHLGQTVNGVRLLKPETLLRLHTADSRPIQAGLDPTAIGYANGWVTRSADWLGRDPSLGKSIGHDGSDGYWLAEVEAFPKANFAILLMSNTRVDTSGNDIEMTAFAEIKARLTVHFAAQR